MARLEKARELKSKNNIRAMLIIAVVLAVLTASFLYVFTTMDSFPGISTENNVELIDMEKSAARIDFFDQTYVRIFMHDDIEASEVTVNGNILDFNVDGNRWETVIQGLQVGEKLDIRVKTEQADQHTVFTVETF